MNSDRNDEPDWDTIAEQRAEDLANWADESNPEPRANDDIFHCPSCGAMPGEPHREPCPF